MKKIWGGGMLLFALFATVMPAAIQADSLSAMLGATKMDGLTKFADCQNEAIGYRERLIADRLELKLANTPGLSPQERALWLADIAALRQVQQTRKPFSPPNPRDPQRYLLGLTDQEQVAINSINSRYVQEVHLKCEQLYGGMTRYAGPNADLSGQIQYENQLRAQMSQNVPSLEAIPVEPLPIPKSPAEVAQEKKAARQAIQQAAMQNFNQCTAAAKGLRPRLVAEALQRRLDNTPGISTKERGELQTDIQAAWASAGKGLDKIESADPKNPYRAEMRLTPQEQMEINHEYSQQYMQLVQTCITNQRQNMGHLQN